MEMAGITQKEFRSYQKLLLEELGIRLGDGKSMLVQGRLSSRMRKLGIRSFEEYYKYATDRSRPEEKEILVHLLTTHETRFFRDAPQFSFLESVVRARGEIATRRPFRAWSAACSTGEEAYSIAMLLAGAMGMSGWEVLASDVSLPAVEKASKCLFEVRRQGDIPESYLKRFCLRGVDSMKGYFTVVSEIRNNIKFRCINLMDPCDVAGEFDVILLSNVLIYFDKHARKAVVEKLRDRLRPGGYLIVGSSESLNGITEDLQWIQQSIYRREK